MDRQEHKSQVKKLFRSGTKDQIAEAVSSYFKKYHGESTKKFDPTEIFNGKLV